MLQLQTLLFIDTRFAANPPLLPKVAELDYEGGKLKCKRDKYTPWQKERRAVATASRLRAAAAETRHATARAAEAAAAAAAAAADVAAKRASRAARRRPDGTFHGTPRAASSSQADAEGPL
jgi:hypothetical protein